MSSSKSKAFQCGQPPFLARPAERRPLGNGAISAMEYGEIIGALQHVASCAGSLRLVNCVGGSLSLDLAAVPSQSSRASALRPLYW